MNYEILKRGSEYSRTCLNTGAKVTASQNPAGWVWTFHSPGAGSPKRLQFSESTVAAIRAWVEANVVRLDRTLPADDPAFQFIERVVVRMFGERDEWVIGVDTFARWAKHFYPDQVTGEVPND